MLATVFDEVLYHSLVITLNLTADMLSLLP